MTAGLKRTLLLAAVLTATLIAPSCGGRKSHSSSADRIDDAPRLAVYKARATDERGRSRRFRIQIFAGSPDRIHAEIQAPVGGTRLILDGGGGNLAVTVVPDKITLVGPADRRAIDRVFGLDLSVEELVALLLAGKAPGRGIAFTREPPAGAGYPDHLGVSTSGVGLEMNLVRTRPLADGALHRLCNGMPPEGMEIVPLEQLDDTGGPLLFPDEEEAR